jgi:putative flippase GtrA
MMIDNLYNNFRFSLKKKSPFVFNLLDRHKKICKFVLAGGTSTAVHLLSLYLLHQYLNLAVVIASSLAFVIAFIVSFSLQKYWTFRNYSKKQLTRQLSIYLIIAIISLNINAFAIHYLVNVLNIWYLLAQLLVSFLISIFNFFSYKLLVFKKNENIF